MVNYSYFESKDVINNVDPKYCLETIIMQFPLLVEQPCYLNYIDLFFNRKNAEQDGVLNIEIRYEEKFTSFKIKLEDIPIDASLRLVLSKKPFIKDKFNIVVKSPQGKITSIWMNDKGPCLRVNADINKNVSMEYSPLISIITPIYKTNLAYLDKTIQSVKEQHYPMWEWCLVDDGSNEEELKKKLLSIKDKRIKVRINKSNAGIAKTTNDAINMAEGEFVCFLDHDDLLSLDALQEVAALLNKHKDTDMIYTDEDKVEDSGSFKGAFYKPDWNYGLFLSHMYTCHLGVYRKSIVDEIKGIRMGFEGSQDYDMVLRLIEKTNKIRHIPKILYHWRISAGSTSQSILNKPNARLSAVKALNDHFIRINRPAQVSAGPFQGHYHVSYTVKECPSVLIVVPFKDKIKYVENFIYTFFLTDYPANKRKVVFINNGSVEEESKSYIKEMIKEGYTVVDYDKPFNYAAINNFGAGLDKSSDLLLFINNDIEIMEPQWLQEMTQHFQRPEVAAVGAKLLYIDHRIQHAGIFVGVNGVAGHGHKNMWDWQPGYFGRPHCIQDISAVTGACLLVRWEDFWQVGGFEDALPKAFNDVDLCLKLRKRNRIIVYTPYARMYHHESVSRGYDSVQDEAFLKAIEFMNKKWGCLKYNDPYYNPNLTKIREDFSV